MLSTIPVIIIGAGPVGLSAGIALSRQGIRNIVIEKHPGISIHPKARGINVRTMELCRIWGAEQKIRECELPVRARRFLWMNHVKGEIQGDVSFITEQEEFSPTEPCLLSQDIFEQKLLACLEIQKNSQIYFNTTLVSIEQDDQFVYCELENFTDKTRTKIRCQYLIAADGANSFVRKKFDIGMDGIPLLGTHVSVYCEADLSSWLSAKPFAVMAFTDKEQMGRVMMAVDLKHRWIFSKRVADANEILTEEAGIQLVRATVNEPGLAVKVINISKWEMAALNAKQYRHDRIFLCGDALFEKNYVLLAGENCVLEKLKLPIPEKYPKTTLVIGKDVHLLNQDFYSCYQITKEQAVLVRPDGHIAWISH